MWDYFWVDFCSGCDGFPSGCGSCWCTVGGRASTCLQIRICGLILWSIFMVVLAYPNLWVDYLVWVNSLVDLFGLD